MNVIDEIVAALDDLCQVETMADAPRVTNAVRRVRRGMIAFGGMVQFDTPAGTTLLDIFFERVYPRLVRTYQAAGCPNGPDEEGMWRWLRQQAAIAAEAERLERERAWQRGLGLLRQQLERRQAVATPLPAHDTTTVSA
jgi:hypothetical protein